MLRSFFDLFRSPPPPSSSSARYLQQNWKPPSAFRYGPMSYYNPLDDFSKRIDFGETMVIYAWPSCGGVIMLENASVADFDFLGLDRLNPLLLRCDNCEAEDAFSQQLLLLGAKWWDSMERCRLLKGLVHDHIEIERSPPPTVRERCWVSVAWPSTGGVVVSEYVTKVDDGGEEQDPEPDDACRLLLCTTMDEKATMLKEKFRGKTWKTLDDYNGNSFIASWGTKVRGEVGELLQLWPIIVKNVD